MLGFSEDKVVRDLSQSLRRLFKDSKESEDEATRTSDDRVRYCDITRARSAYEILNVPQNASYADISKASYKMAKLCIPTRDEASLAIALSNRTLSNPKSRKYNTGLIESHEIRGIVTVTCGVFHGSAVSCSPDLK